MADLEKCSDTCTSCNKPTRPIDLIVQRLQRQSTWTMLATQFLAIAAYAPAQAPVLGIAAGICGIVKLFIPEDATSDQNTRAR